MQHWHSHLDDELTLDEAKEYFRDKRTSFSGASMLHFLPGHVFNFWSPVNIILKLHQQHFKRNQVNKQVKPSTLCHVTAAEKLVRLPPWPAKTAQMTSEA